MNDKKIPIIDFHSHMMINMTYLKKDLTKRVKSPGFWNPFKNMLDLQKIKEGNYKVIVFNIYVPGVFGIAVDFYEEALRQFGILEEFVKKNSNDVALVKNYNEIEKNWKEGKISIIPALEGGHHLDSTESLDIFKDKGIFYITLTHFVKNRISGACTFQFMNKYNGITDFGKAVIKRMEEVNIIPDLAHISEEGFYQFLDLYNGPVFISHGAVRAFNDSERNISDDQILEIGRRDGLMGIIMFPWYLTKRGVFSTAEVWAKTAAHIAELIGPEHVNLGSDFDGEIFSVKGVKDASEIQNLRIYLAKEGFTNEEIEMILWKNSYNFLKKYYN